MNLLLTREPADGRAVRGVLTLSNGQRLPTLENLDYLIPCGTYPVLVTYSPRFKRPLPVVTTVPGRTGIRFHRGSKPEHSRGCILLSAANEQTLTAWLSSELAKLTIV